MRPEFVDNRAGNTLETALIGLLDDLKATLRDPVGLAIATGYFNPEGFGRIAHKLEGAGKVRLLLGAEPVPPPARPVRHLDEPRGERFEQQITDRALRDHEAGLRRDRDLLAFVPATDRALRKLLEFLASGQIEVRRYEKRFLHGKAFIFSRGHGVLAGSSNFTSAGLVSNLELNLGHYQPHVVERVDRWFEDLWAEAAPYDLASLYASRFAEYDPYLIYLRVLWERYQHELEDERPASGPIPLTRFQTDGLDRGRRMLARYNGVLIADSVGLGKSFMAGALLNEVINQKRQRALLIAPAALRDGTWARFQKRFQQYAEIKSYEQVMADSRLGGDRVVLDAHPDEYSLIVIDEAHAYRHLDTRRSQALRRLLQGDPPKQVVLMTATPVNNSVWDLYDLLTYFIGHDAVFSDRGIPSLKKRFDDVAKTEAGELSPTALFDILDSVTVRRTRHFVKSYYANDRIKAPDGTTYTIQFPEPHVEARTYDLEKVLPGFFEEFARILQPEDGEPLLTMARYAPSSYGKGGKAEARELALVGLIRTGLLKRFESSAFAFSNTLASMIRSHQRFLEALAKGVLPTADELHQLEDDDSEEAWAGLLDDGKQVAATNIDIRRLSAAVDSDRQHMQSLLDRTKKVTQKRDTKLELLAVELARIVREAARDGVGDEDIRNRRKVLIFSYYADTVEWIVEYLKERMGSDKSLAAYRGRLAAVRGTEGVDDVGRMHAVYGFAPRSTEAPSGLDEDKYDILVTTDVLAEGMNLQQAARIINYDLPWNPMRLVQRHGRIDRIGSPHRDVHIICIFPDRQLDRMLALEDRIRRKLAHAAASVGLDQMVIPGSPTSDHVFAENVEEIEKLRSGDATLFRTAGEDVHAHSGEEYRQELRKALETREQAIRDLPGAAGSGLARGEVRGHFFLAKIDDRTQYRFVSMDGATIERDALACLRRITCDATAPRVMPHDLAEAAYGAWQEARADIFAEWQKATDPANLTPEIRRLFRAAGEHVRRFRPSDMTQEKADRLVECLEAPWGYRIERALREVFDPDDPEGEDSTRALEKRVLELGLQPWKAPEPLPPIDEEEIALVVWIAVDCDRPIAVGPVVDVGAAS
ncbi:MAG: DEAD/DEAH box helicase family protein [Candidatus Eisenbacteria bacterium]|nr:DEAD/DEAH box helicase family protein [Candidatus Eisenbacteria bacterium]